MKIINLLAGGKNIIFEYRVFNILILAASFSFFSFSIVSVLFKDQLIEKILNFMIFMFFLVLYIFSRYYRLSASIITISLTFYLFIIFPFTWAVSDGISGYIPYDLYIVIALIIFFKKGFQRYLYIVITGMILLMVYLYFDCFKNNSFTLDKFKNFETFLHLVISLAVFSLLLIIITNRYIYKRELASVFLKKAENMRDEAYKAKDIKNKFLSNMSHQLRTPLNSIMGFNELLGMTALDEEQQSYQDMVRISSTRLLEIITDILDITTIETGDYQLQMSPFKLSSMINRIKNESKENIKNPDITLRTIIDPSLPVYIVSDEMRVSKVIKSLLTNAINYSDSGTIYLECTKRIEDNTHLIEISVIDNGIGVSEEHKELIFQSFSRLDNSKTAGVDGLGIGLSISKKIVEKLGGNIGCESDPGKGSKFFFTIPLVEAGETKSEYDRVKSIINHRNCKILIVEDNRINSRLLGEVLKKIGIDFDTASDGLMALEKFNKNKYDLIFMDLDIPLKNGIAVTKDIREFEKHAFIMKTPIIAVTSNALPEQSKLCLESGMDDYIIKPVKSSKIYEIIEKYTGD